MVTVQEKAMCVLWFLETKSVITTQRRFRTTYKKDPPSDNSIRRWLTQFQETGSVLHRKGAGRPSTSQENVDRIQETFTRSPRNVCQEHCVQDPLDELKRRIVTVIQNVTPQMLKNTWREIEFRLDVLRATKGTHVQIH
ncbi:hypothetical protein AVEN_123266-1 [Araneus ventricosus]|uniref:DUF4817 domain-containing protein n=1 Tax=Araneus ventricosus TaxID=182803 RepID=A0A4Y2P7P0_ARAVE|nr:hypothetical protein AVEN_97706-1 [Araneus ventricosus]GBN47050.1 hypothetical protein AVEN_123266-1 [Araneus ventricosus]